jgi:cell division septal protein FtsQ
MKGKSLNRRLSSTKIRRQQHLLEVTVRADKARAMRFRAVASFICKTIMWVMLLGGAYFGGKELLRRFVWENPDYNLTDIRVSTGDLLQRDQILASAGIDEGMNIFKVDTKKARVALDALPQVERAEIELHFPNRVDITITERRPIAWVTQSANENPTVSANAWLIDARAAVMKPRQIVEQYRHLPHISGVTVEARTGPKVNTVEMESALKLIQLNSDNTRWQVRHIDLTKQWCMIVTDQNNARFTFGLDEVDGQLDRLFRYLKRAEDEQKEIDSINLMVAKFTPVTFRQSTALADDSSTSVDKSAEAEKARDREYLTGKSPAASSAKNAASTQRPGSTPKPGASSARTMQAQAGSKTQKTRTEAKPTPRPQNNSANSASSTNSASPLRKPFRQTN